MLEHFMGLLIGVHIVLYIAFNFRSKTIFAKLFLVLVHIVHKKFLKLNYLLSKKIDSMMSEIRNNKNYIYAHCSITISSTFNVKGTIWLKGYSL